MPNLDLIKQEEQGARDRGGRFAKGRLGNPAGSRAAAATMSTALRPGGRARAPADPQRRRHPGYDKVGSGAGRRGAITPGEGFTLSQMMETFLRAIDASDFEGRLRELEEDQAARREEAEARRYNWAARFDSPPGRD